MKFTKSDHPGPAHSHRSPATTNRPVIDPRTPQVASFFFLFVCLLTSGCKSPEHEAEHHHPIHKPSRFDQAVDRLAELSGRIQRGDTAPNHADHHHHHHHHGGGHGHHHHHGHSHHHHHHTDAPPPDAWTEFGDLVRWLPQLAADSDLQRTSWEEVNQICRQMEQAFTSVMSESEDSRITHYGQQADQFDQWIQELANYKPFMDARQANP